MKKICYVATIPAVVHAFLRGHIRAAAEKYDVTVVCNNADAHLLDGINARLILLPIERKASPWRDLMVLIQLMILFRRERFDLVHSIMPKTGLLSMLAAWAAGVPNRMHIFTGQVWATKQGWKRGSLKMFDRLIVLFANQILMDSPSQRDFLVSEGILPQGNGIVIGHGSICGVDADQFHPDAQVREKVRRELDVSLEQTIILFLGRLNRDKGILDLAAAFVEIASKRTDAVLVLVGAEEDISFAYVQAICGAYGDRLRRVSFTTNPERYMAAADIFCLPSYREGFGQVIIEAGATEVPTVATCIYGVTDAVEDRKTGLLFSAGDVAGLTQSLLKLIDDRFLRHEMGTAARARALELFPSHKISEGMLALYGQLLTKRCD
ncbi:glycosyltransferase family 4 protein [Methylobacter sp. Wu8]|uniref:glycosyltransferase family 4 protein n=1 Tax=Methylobacter sp. Wu8 TaxID=3118457 RepID=UPI002F318191